VTTLQDDDDDDYHCLPRAYTAMRARGPKTKRPNRGASRGRRSQKRILESSPLARNLGDFGGPNHTPPEKNYKSISIIFTDRQKY